jgi:hypothetical protein
MVRLSIDVDRDVYNCLENMARQRQMERGGRASKAEILREILESICKEKGYNKEVEIL